MGVNILKGDCREVLRTLPSESVHCVVTSPPYWGLRDYGTAKWEGGDAGCDHKQTVARHDGDRGNHNGGMPGFHGGDVARGNKGEMYFRDTCGKCGARRIDSQFGLEPTPQEYVAAMVEVFREVRRVLRKDGTLWLNLGDSYASTTSGTSARGGSFAAERAQWQGLATRKEIPFGLKSKDLCGIPWRVGFALQADGWYLRQDIIWSKPNPMPESVTDRCTKAHEYLFLLSKSERYYYDAGAIKEPNSPETQAYFAKYQAEPVSGTARKDELGKYGQTRVGAKSRAEVLSRLNLNGRNKRSVWEVATQPFPEAHFATFPPALIEPCIKAGSSEKGCCPRCGAPWIRGWVSSCICLNPGYVEAVTVPCTVLDPFGGAGTTGLVADRLGRNAILIELNPQYAAMAERRLRDDAGMFAQVAAE